MGRDVCRLRKAYYSARHEAAVQIDEIVGETASEADSSDSLERDHGHHHGGGGGGGGSGGGGGGSHDKDDDVIRCICGMYKDEGLMIQCEKCMVRKGQKRGVATFVYSQDHPNSVNTKQGGVWFGFSMIN